VLFYTHVFYSDFTPEAKLIMEKDKVVLSIFLPSTCIQGYFEVLRIHISKAKNGNKRQ